MTVVKSEREERLTVRGDGKAEIVSERVSEGEWDVSAKRLYECLEHGCGYKKHDPTARLKAHAGVGICKHKNEKKKRRRNDPIFNSCFIISGCRDCWSTF